MKQKQLTVCGITLCVVLGLIAWQSRVTIGEEKPTAGVYELRTYTTLEGRLPALLARFKNHTIRLFEKHGMKNGQYLVPTDEKLSKNTLIYVLWHASPEAAKKSWDAFKADPEWHKVRDESEKDGKIVAKADAVYMTLTDFSPKP